MTSLLIFVALFAQQTAPPEKCVLSGTVIDSITGQPLDKVRVVAEHSRGREPGASTTTDAKGAFELVNLDPGDYRLQVSRSGYLQTYYGAKGFSYSKGSTIVLTAGQTIENLRVKLTPFGVIAGTVRDSDGEPVAGAAVNLFGTRYQNGRRIVSMWNNTITTDDLGQFRMPGLSPGKYYVAASLSRMDEDRPTVDHSAKPARNPDPLVTTFYPGTTDPSNAGAIDLAPGTRQSGIDIALVRSRIHKVIAHVRTAPGMRANGRLSYANEGFGQVGQFRKIDQETLEISGVPSGSYVLRFHSGAPDKTPENIIDLTEAYDGCGTSVPISLGRNATEEINVTAPGCAHITGRVVTDNGKPLKDSGRFSNSFTLDQADDGNYFLKADSSFRITVSPGRHTLDFHDLGQGNDSYTKSIRSGNQELLRSGFTASGGENIELEVVLGSDGGKAQGLISDRDGKPVAAATVVMIPSDPALRTRADYTFSVIANQAGRYEIKAIAPGDYKLFAFENIEKDSWFDPDVIRDIEAQGTPINIKAIAPDAKDKPAQTADLVTIR